MNGNVFLINLLRKRKTSVENSRKILILVRKLLYPHIRQWARECKDPLPRITPSGSYAKGTAVKGMTDIDLLISFRNGVPHTLEEIYNSLYDYFDNSFPVRKQNVSIRINYRNIKIDLVPAKRMPNATYPHSIWVNKKNAWTVTNIQRQIQTVKSSGRINEVVLMKIWRDIRGLDFPSFYLELSVIEALKGRRIFSLEKRIIAVLEYLRDRFLSARVVDPANLRNVISDDLNREEKKRISYAAGKSLKELYWERIIWGLYAKSSI